MSSAKQKEMKKKGRNKVERWKKGNEKVHIINSRSERVKAHIKA
jgi:hypothetical protein